MSNFELLSEVEPYFISIVEKSTPGKPSVAEFGFATKLTEKNSNTNARLWRQEQYLCFATLGSHIPNARGYFTLWDKGRPCGLSHPKAQDFLADHGLSVDDFQPPVTQTPSKASRQVTKVRRIKRDRLIQSPHVTFGEQLVGRDGKLTPGKYQVVMRDIQPTLSLEDLELDELRDLAIANGVKLGSAKTKKTILKKLQDASVTL